MTEKAAKNARQTVKFDDDRSNPVFETRRYVIGKHKKYVQHMVLNTFTMIYNLGYDRAIGLM